MSGLYQHTHTYTHAHTNTHTCTEREGQRGKVWLEITNSVSCLQMYDTTGQSKFVLKNLRHYTVHPNMVGGKASPQDLWGWISATGPELQLQSNPNTSKYPPGFQDGESGAVWGIHGGRRDSGRKWSLLILFFSRENSIRENTCNPCFLPPLRSSLPIQRKASYVVLVRTPAVTHCALWLSLPSNPSTAC